MPTRCSEVAVLTLIAECRMVGFFKLVARVASLIKLALRFPEPSHVVVIRIVSFSPKLLPISRLFLGGQRCVELVGVIYRASFGEAKEAPYRLRAVLEEQGLAEPF